MLLTPIWLNDSFEIYSKHHFHRLSLISVCKDALPMNLWHLHRPTKHRQSKSSIKRCLRIQCSQTKSCKPCYGSLSWDCHRSSFANYQRKESECYQSNFQMRQKSIRCCCSIKEIHWLLLGKTAGRSNSKQKRYPIKRKQ